MIPLIASAAVLAAYNCQLEAPRAIAFDGTKVTGSEIALPPMALAFAIELRSGNPAQAKVTWEGDPMQAAGQYPALAIAPGSYAFSAYSSGPCLFTDQACITQFNLVEATDGKANLIVTPVALATDKATGARNPFAVIARGQCTRTDSKK
jgi:hypothetical protein